MNDSEIGALEYELFVRPTSDADAAACAERLAAGIGSLADRLRYYLWLVPPMEDRRPDWAVIGPHLIALILEAPFLRSVNSTGVAEPNTPEHEELARAWATARRDHGYNPEILRRAFEFYFEFDLFLAAGVLKEMQAIDRDHPTSVLYAGCLQLKGADCGLPGFDYLAALHYLEAAVIPGSNVHVSPGLAATAAFEVSMHERAEVLAREAIEVPGYGLDDQAHLGWTTLGRLAAACGDRVEAISHLESSVVPCLSHAGPSMRLAADLARVGDSAVVAAFLARVARSWKGPSHRVSLWLTALESHDIPALLNPGR
jgi:hypothetical protein